MFFCFVTAISAHCGDIAIPPVDYSSDEEGSEVTSFDTASSETSSISSMGKQAILEEVRCIHTIIIFFLLLVENLVLNLNEPGVKAKTILNHRVYSPRVVRYICNRYSIYFFHF